MIERDLARLRFLNTRVMKGEYLNQEDIAFVLDKKKEILMIEQGIDEILESQRMVEEML